MRSHVLMNKAQQILLKSYSAGDYAWLLDKDEAIINGAPSPERPAEAIDKWLVGNAGDTLLVFLFRELGEDGETDLDEYVRRMHIAKGDIQEIVDAMIAGWDND